MVRGERERERVSVRGRDVWRVKSCLKEYNQTFDPSSSIYLELPPKDPNKLGQQKIKYLYLMSFVVPSLYTYFEFDGKKG